MDTNWGLVADERINKLLDMSKINDKSDFLDELRRQLSQTITGRNIIDAGKKGKNRGFISFEYIADEMYRESHNPKNPQQTLEEFVLEKQKRELKKKMPAVQRKYWRGQEQQRVLLLNAGIRENIWTIRTKYSGLIFVTRYRSVKTGRFVKKPSFVK